MSATVTTGKSSAAFCCADGVVIYVLFEKTYANCHPYTPRWSCIAIGEYADVMFRVFQHATCCEGRMLQGDGGRTILPENYVAAWRRQLVESVQMPDMPISLMIGAGYRASIPEDKLEEARMALAAVGREKVFDDIKAGQATLSLHKDIDAVLALYGVNKLFAPWKILDRSSTMSIPMPKYAPKAVIGKIDPPSATLYQFDDGYLLGKIGSAPWKALGRDYLAVGQYVIDYAYTLEMQQTGCAKRLIADFRELCATASQLPPSTTVTVLRKVDGLSSWNIENADRLACELGVVEAGQPAPETFQFVFSDVMAKKAIYSLLNLAASQVTWDVPVQQPSGVPQHTQQLDLLIDAA